LELEEQRGGGEGEIGIFILIVDKEIFKIFLVRMRAFFFLLMVVEKIC
jgi:hypothetical protein